MPAVWFRKYYAEELIPVFAGIFTCFFLRVFKAVELLIPNNFVYYVELPLKKVNWMDFKLLSS
jgi:hypothetical protein